MKKVRVRIAVAVDSNGRWTSCGGSDIKPINSMAYVSEVAGGVGHARYWIEADLPSPEVPMRLWVHDETGRARWSETRPSRRYHEVGTMYEDELPENISDKEYSAWFEMSAVVDGIRMGPVFRGQEADQES